MIVALSIVIIHNGKNRQKVKMDQKEEDHQYLINGLGYLKLIYMILTTSKLISFQQIYYLKTLYKVLYIQIQTVKIGSYYLTPKAI